MFMWMLDKDKGRSYNAFRNTKVSLGHVTKIGKRLMRLGLHKP